MGSDHIIKNLSGGTPATCWNKKPWTRGVQTFGIPGPCWKKCCLGPHIKYTNIDEIDEQKGGLKQIYNFVLGHIHSHPGP